MAEAIECATVLDDDHQEYMQEMEKYQKGSSSSNLANQGKNKLSGRGDTRTFKKQRTMHKVGGRGDQGICPYCNKFHPVKSATGTLVHV